MRRQAPPYEAIEAFLTAARCRTFREAAEVVGISSSALSRRVQLLEQRVGRQLLTRDGAGTTLSTAGVRYFRELEPAAASIQRASQRLRGEPTGEPIRLILSHSLATEWLAPRLGDLHRQQPGVSLGVRIAKPLRELLNGQADLAIHPTTAERPDLPHARLMLLEGVPVAAPELLELHRRAAAAPNATLRRLAPHEPRDLWERWLGDSVALPLGPLEFFATQALVYEAAAAGLGVAIGVSPLVNRFLVEGRLAPCLGPPTLLGASYEIVFRDEFTRDRPDVRALTTWLVAEGQRSRRIFREVTRSGVGQGQA